MPLINLLICQVVNINLSRRLIILRSSLGIAAIGFYKVGTAEKPILITFSTNSSSSLVLFTSSILSLIILL